VLGRVMFPTLAAMQHDHARAASAYRRVVRVMNMLTIPALVGVAATSPSLVPVLWGERWLPMVPLLAIVCLAGVPQSMMTSSGWIYQSQGRTVTMFKMGLVNSVPGVAMMIAAVQWGPIGIAWAVLARSWLFLFPTIYVACRVIDLSAVRVLRDNLVTLVLSALMGALVWFLPAVVQLDRSAPTTLLWQVLTGVVFYLGGTLLLQRQIVYEARHLLRSKT